MNAPPPTELQPNIYPETAAKIAHARDLTGHPLAERIGALRSIGELLASRAGETPDKNFLTFYDDGGRDGTFTYSEFHTAVLRVAGLLANELGIRSGDRVATLTINDPRTALVYFAVWTIGGTVVPVNCGEDDERVGYILANSSAKALFAMPEQADRLAAMRGSLPELAALIQIGGETREGFRDFDRAVAGAEPLESAPNVAGDTEALIVYTSGTTGAPKGVVLEQVNLIADAESIAEWHRFTPDDRAMCVLPIHHVNGIEVTLVTPLVFGGSVVLNRRFSALRFWRTLADERCTYVSVVPTILAFLSERHSHLVGFDLSRLRHIICGAGPLTVDLAKRFHETFGVRVVHGYGLSETTCYSCFLPIDLDEASYRYWMLECGFPSIGCPISVNEMAIHDANGTPLPDETRGEIVIRGHNVMRYYFQRPDVNRDTFAHGWFRSGDEGFCRKGADGRDYFFITGRIKELIIRGGVNYSPFDIDEVLNAIPGVKAAMAVGFENDFYGEEVGAYVQMEEGVTLTEEEVLKAARAHLPAAKCPKVVVFAAEFPVTSTGKYQRNKLKPLFLQWKGVYFRPT